MLRDRLSIGAWLQESRYHYRFLFVLLCIVSSACPAKTYTVSDKQSLNSVVMELRSGDILLIKGGVYRQTIKLPSRTWLRPITIAGVPGEKAIIRGSDPVADWVSVGEDVWIKRGWPHNSQQVFVDDKPLRQVGGTIFNDYPASGCKSGLYRCGSHTDKTGGAWPGRLGGDENDLIDDSFYYDTEGRALYIKTAHNPNEATVEASVRQQWINGSDISGLTIKNIIFQHSNSSAFGRGAAIRLVSSNNVTIDSITAVRADYIAVSLRGNNNTIKNSIIRYAGAIGITASGDGLKIQNNEVSHNNYRGFNKGWGAGGMKLIGGRELHGFGGIRGSDVSGNKVIFNNGDGIWCDFCREGGNRIHDNFIAYNRKGIHWEVSHNSLIYNNIIFGNSNTGLYTSGSNGNLITHNLIMFNSGPEGNLAITERVRFEFPDGNTAVGNLIGWGTNARELFLPKNIGNNRSDYNLILTTDRPISFHGNRKNPYTGLPAWRKATGQDKNSWVMKIEIPDSYQKALQKKTLHIDWTPVLDIAKRYSVKVNNLANMTTIGAIPPGPAPGSQLQ